MVNVIPDDNGIDKLSLRGKGRDSIIIPAEAVINACIGFTNRFDTRKAANNPNIVPSIVLFLLYGIGVFPTIFPVMFARPSPMVSIVIDV